MSHYASKEKHQDIFNLTMFVKILLAITENLVSSSISYLATGTDNYL